MFSKTFGVTSVVLTQKNYEQHEQLCLLLNADILTF